MLQLAPLAFLVFVGIFVAMLAFLEIGRRMGERQRAIDPDGVATGTGAVVGAVFALLGLLIAFTFSGAASRFDARRQLVVEEANAIGTAYLRIDLLPPAAQPKLRDDFRSYVDARLAFYRKLPDLAAAKVEMDRYTALQNSIWAQAVAGSQQMTSPAVMSLVLASINDMIDITTTRYVALQTHPPSIIFVMLAIMVLASCLLAGYDIAASKRRSWLHMLGYALLTTLALYVILDLEFPRVGLVRIDYMDQLLVDVRNSMR
jgi:CDP-diglyceride synthetase